MIVKYRNTQINTDVLDNYTEAEFRETFKGIIDVELACKELKKYFKEDVQSDKETSKKRKRVKIKGTVSDSL